MFLHEFFIAEDVAETKDLMAIAYYLASWFASPMHMKNYVGEPLTLRDIESISGKKAPALQTKSVKWLMYKEIPNESPEPLRFVSNRDFYVGSNEFGAYNPPYVHAIGINLELIKKRNKSIPSTLLHELDHALVDMKSGGRSAASYQAPTQDTFKSYLQHPLEINARFAQSLWDLAVRYNSISKGDVYTTVTNVFAANHLSPEIIPDPKQYKKLISRAYKFLDEVGQIIADKPKDKATLVQKVKNLIKKWVS